MSYQNGDLFKTIYVLDHNLCMWGGPGMFFFFLIFFGGRVVFLFFVFVCFCFLGLYPQHMGSSQARG